MSVKHSTQTIVAMRKILLSTIAMLACFVSMAQVAINTDGSLPDNSAMLDVNSTDKGMLIPRMTSVQRDEIISPATGLLIFCYDDNKYYSNNGTPDEPYWLAVNSQWISYGSNIYYPGGKVGLGIVVPIAVLDIMGGNNWDLINGEGDFRLGNAQYRIKRGIALGGGGAGAAGIMQYGQPGGYNVLKLGAQGSYLLYINGETQKVGIGTDNPGATLDVQGSLRVADGTQGAGKFLTSDANGTASWAAPGSGGTHTIGESYGGGIVFYVTPDGQHGLIAEIQNQATSCDWMTAHDSISMPSAHSNAGKNFTDWRLPTKYELNLLYVQRNVVGGFANDYYWTSIGANGYAWSQYFLNGAQFFDLLNLPSYVRAIRAF